MKYKAINKKISKQIRKDLNNYNTDKIKETIEKNKLIKISKNKIMAEKIKNNRNCDCHLEVFVCRLTFYLQQKNFDDCYNS